MPRRNALLIQSIGEYVSYLRPHLEEEIFLFGKPDIITVEEMISFIICEECYRCFGYVDDHYYYCRNHLSYQFIYNALLRKINLSHLTHLFINIPKLYGDNVTIKVHANLRDLWIEY